MIKKHKNKLIIISLAFIGVILIVFGSFNFNKNKSENEFSATTYTKDLEKKIEGFLKNVDGIRNVRVILTLDTSNEHIYAKNDSSYDYFVSSNGTLVEITERFPVVRGVAIACTNGDDDTVKMKVTELISSYLGISSNRIKIVEID
jgi:stage III sporulation protein AG